jgi:hypothetical protein
MSFCRASGFVLNTTFREVLSRIHPAAAVLLQRGNLSPATLSGSNCLLQVIRKAFTQLEQETG